MSANTPVLGPRLALVSRLAAGPLAVPTAPTRNQAAGTLGGAVGPPPSGVKLCPHLDRRLRSVLGQTGKSRRASNTLQSRDS